MRPGLTRGSLSAFHRCCQFICHNSALEVLVWSEVTADLQCFRGFLMLGISPWRNRWNEYVHQSDASLTGHGVRVARWPREQVERAGRISERSRF